MDKCAWKVPDLHRKWTKQVEHIVSDIHKYDIIWVDVNLGNVFIHEDTLKAYVIDFGGPNNRAFVIDELCKPKEGDLQGIGRPTRKRDEHISAGVF